MDREELVTIGARDTTQKEDKSQYRLWRQSKESYNNVNIPTGSRSLILSEEEPALGWDQIY